MSSGDFVATTLSNILLQNSGACKSSFREYLSGGDYAIYSVAPTVELTPANTTKALNVWTADISRFALAAFESMASIQEIPTLPRSLAWSCIKAYYASYFAAHAMLRFAGISLTTFGRTEKAAFRSQTSTYMGTPFHISRGVHVAYLNATGLEINFNIIAEDSSHLPVWQKFERFLENTLREIAALPSTAETQVAIGDISDLVEDLRRRGGATALSTIRNELNYRQSYDVWYPYRARGVTASDVARLLKGWMTTYTTGNELTHASNEALSMVDLATRIVRLCYETLVAAKSLHAGKRSFLDRKVTPFIRLLGSDF